MKGLKKVLLIPDCHRPYYHKRAYNLMLEVAKDVGVDSIYLLGDYADFYSVSSHPKDIRLYKLLENEVQDVNEGLDDLDKLFPKAKKTYICGNHEHRLARKILNDAGTLFGLVTWYELFDLDKRKNWTWVEYSNSQVTRIEGSALRARHEPLSTGQNAARLTSSKALCSIAFAHTHRIEEASITGIDGKSHVSFSCGWLGNLMYREVYSYLKNVAQWQLGFGIVYVDPKTGFFYHNKIHILEKGRKLSCVFNGKRFAS